MNNSEIDSPVSIETLHEGLTTFKSALQARIANLPKYLGLENLQQVRALIDTQEATGKVDSFLPTVFPSMYSAIGVAVRRKRRGVDVGDLVREQIKEALLRGEVGTDISRRLSVSTSTVSGVKKTLKKKRLK